MDKETKFSAFLLAAAALGLIGLLVYNLWLGPKFSGVTVVSLEASGETSLSMPEPEQPGPVDLNQASAGELTALPGIGPVLADRIIRYRAEAGPFSSTEELMEVEGIGQKTFEALKDLVFIGTP